MGAAATVQGQIVDLTNIRWVNFNDSGISSAQGFFIVLDGNGLSTENQELVLSAIKTAITSDESLSDFQVIKYQETSTDITSGI